jgi:tetratricopeptide (TPR) repeat protein
MRAPSTRLSLVFALSFASLAACGGARESPRVLAKEHTPAPEAERLPGWLPPYSSAQLELLAPMEHDLDVAAPRVFPDLARFGYSDNRPLLNPRRAIQLAALVDDVLEKSPRYYVLGTASAELANDIAQYGPVPASEPDPWLVVRRDGRGVGTLAAPSLSPEARRAYDEGLRRYDRGDAAGAVTELRVAVDQGPTVPGFRLGLAEALAKSGDLKGAEAMFEAAVAIDPTLATAHLGLAKVRLLAGHRAAAHPEIAEALALHPGYGRALEVADEVVPGAAGDGDVRIPAYRVFLDVDAKGAVRVLAEEDGAPALAYASCRAAMRYEPDFRAAVFGEDRQTPYYLRVAEEVLCHEAALGAYLAARNADPDEQPIDNRAEALLDLAAREGLSGFVMYEILGKYRPERARTAPPAVHDAVLRYVEAVILGPATAPRPTAVGPAEEAP